MYDFETIHDRKNTYSLKWDLYNGTDICPMWVADMDFQTAPEIVDAVTGYAKKGIYGYSNCPEQMTELLVDRMKRLYNWDTKPEEYLFLPGIVPGMNLACRTFGNPSDKVINMTPVYYPFLRIPGNSGKESLNIPFTRSGNSWEFDFDRLESEVEQNSNVSILQLSNPHNPLGKIFSRSELVRLSEICLKHNILIMSDDIHCDLILNESKTHIPIASLSPEISNQVLTFMSPTKTWGMPGLQFSYLIIQDPEKRHIIESQMGALYGRLSGPAYIAGLAAYSQGQPWLSELLDYLRGNKALVFECLRNLPGISLCEPLDATYLAWFDYSDTGQKNLKEILEKEAGVGLSDGAPFGYEWGLRLNFACPRNMLNNSLEKISTTIRSL